MASEEDYLVVRGLVADVIADGVEATVSPTIRETVACVADLADGDGVTVRRVAERLGLDRSATSRRLLAARERGYLSNLEDRRGRPARYVVGEPLPEERVLLPHSCTPPEDETAGQEGVCTGAGVAEGDESNPPDRFAGEQERELITEALELGHDPDTIAVLLNTNGHPPPPGGVRWTGYLVRSFSDGWGGLG